jgi:hypothetical protein
VVTFAAVCVAASCGGGSHPVAKAGCKPPSSDAKLGSIVVVLIDRSKSTGTPPIRASYTDSVNQVLASFKDGEGGLLAIAPIDENSLAHFNPVECVYPKKGASTNPLVFASNVDTVNHVAREKAARIIEGPRTTKGTTIFDALTSAGRLLYKERDAADKRYLVILSDMVEESERLRMSTPNLEAGAVKTFIAHERSGPFFPRLDGVDVYVAGAGISSSGGSSIHAENVERFWLKYFAATGARLDPVNYGSSLSFP